MVEHDLYEAAHQLAKSSFGRLAAKQLLELLDGGNLDSANQQAVLTLLAGAWGSYGGTARDAIREALRQPLRKGRVVQ